MSQKVYLFDLSRERVDIASPGAMALPEENGCSEGLGRKLRDELLNREIFSTLEEPRIRIENRHRAFEGLSTGSGSAYITLQKEEVRPGRGLSGFWVQQFSSWLWSNGGRAESAEALKKRAEQGGTDLPP